jgi:two-component system sensor kinase FixL
MDQEGSCGDPVVANHTTKLLSTILGLSDLLVVALDPEGRIRVFNRKCEAVTGYREDEVLGQCVWNLLVPPAEREEVTHVGHRLLAGEPYLEYRNHWLTRSGEYRQIRWRNTILRDEAGDVALVLATGVDMTEEEQATLARHHSQTNLQALLNALPVLAARVDRDLRIRYANHGYRDWFGLAPDELIGTPLVDAIGHQAFQRLQPCLRRALDDRDAVFHGELPYASGPPRFIHGNYIPSHGADGTVDGVYILVVDLTQDHELRQQLDTELERSRIIIETAIDGIITIDDNGIVESFNPAAERIFGYRADEIIGRSINMLMPEPHRGRHDDYIHHYKATGESRIIGVGRDVTGVTREGLPIDLRLSVAEYTDQDGRHFVGFTQDITELNRAQREAHDRLNELAHLTRIHAACELAFGLAHEIRQPLMAINASSAAVLELMSEPERNREAMTESLDRILKQSQRAGDIISHLVDFVRNDDDANWEAVNPNDLIGEVLDLLGHDIREAGVRVRVDLPRHPPLCRVDTIQIQQVLFNLIRNAVDALLETGGDRRIEIGTDRQKQSNRYAIRIRDSGNGIAPEDLERLFDPFFTTKTRGLGQGLSICRSLLKRHGSDLEVHNHPQGGAEFQFTLPVDNR